MSLRFLCIFVFGALPMWSFPAACRVMAAYGFRRQARVV